MKEELQEAYNNGYKAAMTEVAKKLNVIKDTMERASLEATNKIWEISYSLECAECDDGIVDGTSKHDDMHLCPICFGSGTIVPDYKNESHAMADKERREKVAREKDERTSTTTT